MIRHGKGGANTCTGLHFEEKCSIPDLFGNLKNYSVSGRDLLFKNKVVGSFYKKSALYSFLSSLGVDWKNRLSKRLLPDEALFVNSNNTLFIIEMKYQHVSGSVDEKLQTCDFKKKQYEKLFKDTSVKVEYCYVLNEWFSKKEYTDTLSYIKEVGCHYFFEDIPFNFLGLPDPKRSWLRLFR